MEQSARRLLYNWFQTRPRALTALRLSNKVLTVLVYLVYILLCLALLWQRDIRLARVLAVPAAVFLSGSWLRAWLNCSRPYENGGVPPLFHKETRGKSFPSRHGFSSAVISFAVGYILPAAGWAMALVTLAVAALRVVGGVHWPRDVLAGLAYGWGLGLIGFCLL